MARSSSPLDRATRAARSALRSVPRDAVISVGSRIEYAPTTGTTGVATIVYLRTDLAAPAEVAALLARLGDTEATAVAVTLHTAA